MRRRRFLTLSAAALCPLPGRATEVREWRGTGFGAALSVQLSGADAHTARRAFARIEAEVERIEATFSLHRDSALTRLNRDGRLAWPSEDMLGLVAIAGRVHAATDGVFDPSVQPLWQALASGGDGSAARRLIGWQNVSIAREALGLAPGRALTFNGIAQGWAADQIAALLAAEGFGNALIDMGELRALGARADHSGWQVGIAGHDGALLAQRPLANRALATSSPDGTMIRPGVGHILGPRGELPVWSTVSVSAPKAALADALSTAFCLMERGAIDRTLATFPDARVELLL